MYFTDTPLEDPNDPTDVALALMKIIDTEATITWDQEIYKDANTSPTFTTFTSFLDSSAR